MPPSSPAADRSSSSPPRLGAEADVPASAGLDLDALAGRLAARVAELIEEARTPPPLLDLDGAARRLNVSTRTVEALVADGEIPVIRIGTGRGVRRFDPAAVEAFIRRNARSL
ncbi:helix-turn-helix domain-containing protein [Rubrivirga marina]|uniref:helix-turn-helix domain-containing protein n=1 Tax=Rubrivirga marina TaxID=1196024 RepID=UPI0015CB240A|nr:helix-turn-helix domain-containing protein [Rubrivirga marina]